MYAFYVKNQDDLFRQAQKLPSRVFELTQKGFSIEKVLNSSANLNF